MSQSVYTQDEITHLRSQNDQLWKIIEKQRVMIQSLQKDNVRLSAERDGLQDKVSILEKELTRKQKVASLLISPSEYIEEDVSTPSSTENNIETSPMPPPRSPYRAIKEDYNSLDSMVKKSFVDQDIDDGRSSPSLKYTRKDSARSVYTNVPSPSKSMDKIHRESLPTNRLEHDRSASPVSIHRSNSIQTNSAYQNNSKPNLNYDDDSFNMANIHIRVVASNIKPNEKGKEVVSFIISVGSYKDDDQFDERWRVEKLYSDFLTLDSKLKAQKNRAVINQIGKLPDKTLFSNNAPTKVDQRKVALEQYLQHVISLPLDDTVDLCEFLSTNVVDAKTYHVSGQKEGYLTKRGKNFGGWKTRYFILNENALEYYESKDGIQLGSIRLTNAQIGTQAQSNTNEDSVYRHAFLIVEQKRAGSTHSTRHILCASSDEDRDGWVQALLQNIQIEESELAQKAKKKTKKPSINNNGAQPVRHLKLDNVSNAEVEKLTPTIENFTSSGESDTSSTAMNTWSSYEGRASLDQRSLQPPRPTVVRRSSTSNLDQDENYRRASSPNEEPEITEKKARNKANRMTFWGKKMLFNNHDEQSSQEPRPSQSSSTTTANGLRGFLSRTSHEQQQQQQQKEVIIPPAKQVFGVSLEEAVRISRVAEGYELPAVVYRCIEYLDAMNAVLEEGIYRLSGSNSMMKALRERFNQEGDVNLLDSKENYDIHVVAGLLKMWLRELPTSVLTREHRNEFLHVIDLLDRKDRINELGRLVSLLPLANYTLLRALTAHLIRVVQHSDINKMTMRNVSIVFSPTLGIPATVFNLLMSEFDYIFWTNNDGSADPRKIEDEENATNHALLVKEEHGRSNRNSVNYMDGAPNAIVDLEKNMEGQPVIDEDDDNDVDDLTLSTDSGFSV